MRIQDEAMLSELATLTNMNSDIMPVTVGWKMPLLI